MVAAYICNVPKLIVAGDVKRSLNKESKEKVEAANNLMVLIWLRRMVGPFPMT